MIINKQKERNTIQKEIIFDFLKSTRSHPSVADVYLKTKKKIPRISQATVYRNLNDLKNKGKVQEILTEVSHFDADVSPHAHFICQKCDRVVDILDVCEGCKVLKTTTARFQRAGLPRSSRRAAAKLKVGKVNNFKIYLYGYCHKCSRQTGRLPRLQKEN